MNIFRNQLVNSGLWPSSLDKLKGMIITLGLMGLLSAACMATDVPVVEWETPTPTTEEIIAETPTFTPQLVATTPVEEPGTESNEAALQEGTDNLPDTQSEADAVEDISDAETPVPDAQPVTEEAQTSPGQSSEALIIDHRVVEQFDRIPDEYIQAASQLRWLHRGASVGYNIAGTADFLAEGLQAPSGLNCLSWTDLESNPFEGGRPNSCGCPEGPLSQRWENFCRDKTVFFSVHPKYSRDNWEFEVHPYRINTDNLREIRNANPGWQNKVNYFIRRVDNLAPDESYDYVSFQMGYVEGPTINAHFFTDNDEVYGSDDSINYDDRQPGIYNLEALAAEHPEMDIIWTTSALSRLVEFDDQGQPYIQLFNDELRNYAVANNKILFDLADIESHMPDGTPCYGIDRNGNPVDVITVCDEYVDEEISGHLNALGANQVAKAIWVMMARLSGWEE